MRKNWLWYQFFRYPLVKLALNLFYKRLIIRGRENLPKNKPILFVPNHQNSFMDALLVVTNLHQFIYFLTRAEAFNPPLLGKFLRSLNMLPVYRVRDGFSSVTKNNEIFEECIGYMKRNDAILIFPEANHDLRRRVRGLSKGFTRIAFGAELEENWEMGLHVVPVGLNYAEHRRSRNVVQVVFGEAIEMKKYKELHEKDEREATQALKDEVHKGMEKVVMHVPEVEHYPLNQVVLVDLEQDMMAYTTPETINANVEKVEAAATPELYEVAKEVVDISNKYDLDPKTLIGRKKPVWALVLFFPLYLFSWLNNLIPYQTVRKLTTQVIKDHAFDASIKFVAGLILFPLFWFIISIILLFTAGWEWSVGYLLLSMFTSVLFKNANLIVRESKARKQLQAFKASNPEEYDTWEFGIMRLNEFRSKVLH